MNQVCKVLTLWEATRSESYVSFDGFYLELQIRSRRTFSVRKPSRLTWICASILHSFWQKVPPVDAHEAWSWRLTAFSCKHSGWPHLQDSKYRDMVKILTIIVTCHRSTWRLFKFDRLTSFICDVIISVTQLLICRRECILTGAIFV